MLRAFVADAIDEAGFGLLNELVADFVQFLRLLLATFRFAFGG